VIQIGPDPLFARFPVRGFRADLTIAADPDLAIPALIDAAGALRPEPDLLARRRARMERRPVAADADEDGPGITRAAASRALSAALEGRPSTVFNELGTLLGPLERRDRLSWFDGPHSGGLGWGVPAALGARLADTGRTVVATVGDGSYIFANPVACHQIAEALDLAILIVVLNNAEWSAVRQSVAGLYPDGHAVRANVMPLTSLAPSPDFRQIAAASRAWARRVETMAELHDGLREALAVVDGGRVALLDVATRPD
jgi:acetolactate synthase-1/2/3 large subunit